MNIRLTRRGFLAATACAAAAPLHRGSDRQLVDYHVHLDQVVTLEKAIELSRERGVTFGIVEHAGTRENKYPGLLSNDEDLKRYLAKLEGKPVLKGIQAEGLDWMTCFSKELVAQLDFVLSDALTLPGKDGHRVELWRPWVKVQDPQEFMERYAAFHVEVMSREPIDILANPTFMPDCLAGQHHVLWTAERMDRVISAAVRHGVAIEINSRYRLPRLAFLERAKKAGAKFSFGSNIHGLDVGKLDYCLEMEKKLGLAAGNIFTPAPSGRKPIERRTFA